MPFHAPSARTIAARIFLDALHARGRLIELARDLGVFVPQNAWSEEESDP